MTIDTTRLPVYSYASSASSAFFKKRCLLLLTYNENTNKFNFLMLKKAYQPQVKVGLLCGFDLTHDQLLQKIDEGELVYVCSLLPAIEAIPDVE